VAVAGGRRLERNPAGRDPPGGGPPVPDAPGRVPQRPAEGQHPGGPDPAGGARRDHGTARTALFGQGSRRRRQLRQLAHPRIPVCPGHVGGAVRTERRDPDPDRPRRLGLPAVAGGAGLAGDAPGQDSGGAGAAAPDLPESGPRAGAGGGVAVLRAAVPAGRAGGAGSRSGRCSVAQGNVCGIPGGQEGVRPGRPLPADSVRGRESGLARRSHGPAGGESGQPAGGGAAVQPYPASGAGA